MKHVLYVAVFMVMAVSLFVPRVSWSQVEGIDGTWYFGEKPLRVEVYDNGWRLSVTNEAGQRANGKALNPDVIYLPSENITGHIEVEATIIEWSDGTYWSRESFTGPEPPNLPE
jgi:hypothetical protein